MHRKSDENLRIAGRRAALWSLRPFIAFSVVLLFASVSFAQVDRSGLSGTITDSSGRLVPQAHVKAIESATGLIREAVSDTSGNYSIPELPLGIYTVTFEHQGFNKLEYVDVEQVIGRTRTLDATLEVSGGEERVEVSPASVLMDRNTSAVTGLIEKEQADELPLNGRNWASLTAFVPGAIDVGGGNQRTVRFAGRGTDDTNTVYDGVDATNIVNQLQRQWVRLAIPLDAISEFRVDTMLSTAQAGGAGGGQLNITSPSGTNAFHGRLFEYVRNNDFDAPLPLWVTASAQQPLHLNQFGGSSGGPIKRDKTFFFLASEAYRQNWGFPESGDVPDPTWLAGLVANPATAPSAPVAAILSTYPKAGPNKYLTTGLYSNTASYPDASDVDLLTCECIQVVNENSEMVRLDQRFSTKTTGFMRFNYDRSVDTQPYTAGATDLEQLVSNPINGELEVLHIFNSHFFDEAKAGFNRSTDNTYFHSDAGTIYSIAVTGPASVNFITQAYGYDTVYVGNSYSGADDLTWVHGRHTLKAGFEYRRIQLNDTHPPRGALSFASLAKLVAGTVKTASYTSPLPADGLRKNDFFFYAQDEYQLRQNLTLNLGARYTIFGLFNESNGLANPFDFSTCGTGGFCGVNANFGNQNLGDFDPRVAFAWTPLKHGQTIIRGGFGLYHEDGQLDDQNLPYKNALPAYNNLTSFTLPSTFPTTPLTFSTGTLAPSAEQRDRKDSYVEQWSLSVQRQLPANFVGTVSYLGSHALHLLEQAYTNLEGASNYVEDPYAFNSNFSAALGWRGSIGMSTYNGLSVAMRRPLAGGLLVTANYMYSHGIDNGSDGSGDGTDQTAPQNPLCQSCEIASSVWDARHAVNGNAVYQLPFGLGKPMLNQRGIASAIAGNWQMTAMALAHTGFPVNVLLPSSVTATNGVSKVLRPDLVPGVSLTPPGGRTVSQWINPAAFAYPAGEFGDAPRNVARGPNEWQIDMSAAKEIPLWESGRLQFRSEFYNIFNHPQPGAPAATCAVTASAPTGCATPFANITGFVSTLSPVSPVGSGTPREIQLALRFDF
jgi:hypothetical protein